MMKAINLEAVKSPGDKKPNQAAFLRLQNHVGKKAILVFREPQSSRRGNIHRHHCTILDVWNRGVSFSPVIRVPRTFKGEPLTDLLVSSAWFSTLTQVEIN